jgi:hypothetical protein
MIERHMAVGCPCRLIQVAPATINTYLGASSPFRKQGQQQQQQPSDSDDSSSMISSLRIE